MTSRRYNHRPQVARLSVLFGEVGTETLDIIMHQAQSEPRLARTGPGCHPVTRPGARGVTRTAADYDRLTRARQGGLIGRPWLALSHPSNGSYFIGYVCTEFLMDRLRSRNLTGPAASEGPSPSPSCQIFFHNAISTEKSEDTNGKKNEIGTRRL